jgi:hypothetical protein
LHPREMALEHLRDSFPYHLFKRTFFRHGDLTKFGPRQGEIASLLR